MTASGFTRVCVGLFIYQELESLLVGCVSMMVMTKLREIPAPSHELVPHVTYVLIIELLKCW